MYALEIVISALGLTLLLALDPAFIRISYHFGDAMLAMDLVEV